MHCRRFSGIKVRYPRIMNREMFAREHHRRIQQALEALDGPVLKAHGCYFGGGTAIALRQGEYRESVDLDFLVSNLDAYRDLRQLLGQRQGLAAIFRSGSDAAERSGEVRSDQYGIRTWLNINDVRIKFEIVFEARINLDAPGKEDAICGVGALTRHDMAATKLLANSDRWADDGVFSRDVIDLAMLELSPVELQEACAKAETAYGPSIRRDLAGAVEQMRSRHGWMERCMDKLAIQLPKAFLWERIRRLRSVGVE